MSDDELGRFSEGFAMWRQILGAVAPDDRLKIFANAASEVAGYVAKGLDKVAAADELTDMAIGCGLDDTDAVQATIVEAFKNGHQHGLAADARSANRPKPNAPRASPASAALNTARIWGSGILRSAAMPDAASPMDCRSRPSSKATSVHSTTMRICSAPSGRVSISSETLNGGRAMFNLAIFRVRIDASERQSSAHSSSNPIICI
jgi:hypothetical protein